MLAAPISTATVTERPSIALRAGTPLAQALTFDPTAHPIAPHPAPDSQPAATLPNSDSQPAATLPSPDSHPAATRSAPTLIPAPKIDNLHPGAANSIKPAPSLFPSHPPPKTA